MALSRVKTWTAETLTASDLNAEFDNIINNASSLISPLGGSLDWDGYAHTLDAAGVTTAQSTSSIGWTFSPGSKSGTPGTTGGIANYAASTWTDNNTAGSGTATAWTGHSFQRPTLAATNSSVTTTDAAVVYIANNVAAGTNETLTNTWSLWVDAGNVRFDGDVYILAGTANNGILTHANSAARTYTLVDATGSIPTIATQAEVNAMTSTITALTPNHNKVVMDSVTATTSGSSFDFTIPSGVRTIRLLFNEVSLDGTDHLLVQLGDSGGVETSGYVSTSIGAQSASTGEATSTAGFIVYQVLAARIWSGIMTLSLVDGATFLWVASHAGKASTAVCSYGGGSKALSAELTTVRLTRSGSDSFDAGSINVQYER